MSRAITFTAVFHIEDIKFITIFKSSKEIYMYYLKNVFQIRTLHVDGEFAPLQVLIQEMPGGVLVNLLSSSEHVPDIERQIRVAKESIRSISHILPFNKVLKLFLTHLLFQVIKMLNHFPVKGGISDTIISTTIMIGKSLHY